jgi:membrane protein DedA with SNARE-associated domain
VAPHDSGGGGVTPELPGAIAWLAPTLTSYGYLAVFGFLFIESFGAPVPGQTMLMAAGVFAGVGRLNVLGIAVLGFFAAVTGDNVPRYRVLVLVVVGAVAVAALMRWWWRRQRRRRSSTVTG